MHKHVCNCHADCRPAKAFTLIEVLVVVAIMALLLSILLPSLRQARASAYAAACASNLHQFGIALATYENEHNGYQPRAGTYTSMQWIMLIVRQVGDKRRYTHVNQVPVGRYPVFQCPQRTATLPHPYIDYVLNGFDPKGSYARGWPEIQTPTRASDWKRPAQVLMIGDAAFECSVNTNGGPCPQNPHSSDGGILRQNRENHPAAMALQDVRQFNADLHASLDRMDLFHPSQVQSSYGRRAGTINHLRSYCNWLHGDGHTAAVQWLNGKRKEIDWLRMYGVLNP